MKSLFHLPPITRTFIPALFILVLSHSPILAQNANKIEKFLIGTWQLDYDQSISQIDRSSKGFYDTLKQERKSMIRNSFSQRKMEFQSDGTYVLVVRDGREVTGTWKLQNDEESLHIILDGNLIEQRIEKINQSFMVLNVGGNQTANRLFRRWYLNKIRS